MSKSPYRLLRSRVIRFQLTSLMDLLLIIVFAQYLEFRRTNDQTRQQSQAQVEQTREELQRQQREKFDQVLAESQRLRDQTEQAEQVADAARAKQQRTETLLQQLMQIDPDAVDLAVSPPESVNILENAQTNASAIRKMDSAELLRFLVGYESLLKRAEIWTVHVSDRGDTEIAVQGSNQPGQSFRFESLTQASRTEEFVQLFRAAYAQIPQPKGLVVILVSYSPRAVAGNYQPVLDGMPRVIEWLGVDSKNRTRFEYAVIGAMADPTRDLDLNPTQ